jgi:hypothetical protein
MNENRIVWRTAASPAYFLGRPRSVYLNRYRRQRSREDARL